MRCNAHRNGRRCANTATHWIAQPSEYGFVLPLGGYRCHPHAETAEYEHGTRSLTFRNVRLNAAFLATFRALTTGS